MDLELLIVAAALSRRQQPHLHQPTSVLLPQSFPAQTCRQLVHGEDEKVHQTARAGAAAAHHRRAAGHFRQPLLPHASSRRTVLFIRRFHYQQFTASHKILSNLAMAEGLRSAEMRRDIDSLKEQFSANIEHNEKMFEDIRSMIAAMETQHHQSHSPRSGEHEGTSDGRGNWGQGYQVPTKRSKIRFPHFNGEDLGGWIFRAEKFFEMDDTPLDTRVQLAAVHFEAKALQWHQNLMRAKLTRDLPPWGEYVQALHDRFGSLPFEDPMSELMTLRQMGSVREYLDKFDELLNNVDLNEGTMRLNGSAKGKTINILIDIGSTHNFLDVETAKRLGCRIEVTKPFPVSVADGNKLYSKATCTNFQWRIQVVQT
ncbi:hypothetical protein BUALT_Bualt10G0009000 [Buddleja alternifolia]|uniref:Retrotransposon gag domain-containing protein n=1 Tax=Buddleja alternifolia TaxID=168488 RepID=A0AAV6WWG9_9LAMI|nr:hypothetical protein BUALT_Bualt10G0009000 [Buddleja alternifolia]